MARSAQRSRIRRYGAIARCCCASARRRCGCFSLEKWRAARAYRMRAIPRRACAKMRLLPGAAGTIHYVIVLIGKIYITSRGGCFRFIPHCSLPRERRETTITAASPSKDVCSRYACARAKFNGALYGMTRERYSTPENVTRSVTRTPRCVIRETAHPR